jgi:hypothetical protein
LWLQGVILLPAVILYLLHRIWVRLVEEPVIEPGQIALHAVFEEAGFGNAVAGSGVDDELGGDVEISKPLEENPPLLERQAVDAVFD